MPAPLSFKPWPFPPGLGWKGHVRGRKYYLTIVLWCAISEHLMLTPQSTGNMQPSFRWYEHRVSCDPTLPLSALMPLNCILGSAAGDPVRPLGQHWKQRRLHSLLPPSLCSCQAARWISLILWDIPKHWFRCHLTAPTHSKEMHIDSVALSQSSR